MTAHPVISPYLPDHEASVVLRTSGLLPFLNIENTYGIRFLPGKKTNKLGLILVKKRSPLEIQTIPQVEERDREESRDDINCGWGGCFLRNR